MAGMGRRILVVGGDGVIGGHLAPFLRKNDFDVIETTRRERSIVPSRLYLDLLEQDAFAVPDNIDAAVVLAAAAHYEQCEHDRLSGKVNVVGIPGLIQRLLERGVFTLFTSSVTVFGGKFEYPGERMNPMPTIAYARQKAECESAIQRIASKLGMEKHLAIVRTTKSFDSKTRPVPDWLEDWRNGRIVKPFTDLVFAPMTLDYISTGLMKAAEARQNGIFHFSNAENINYETFCRRLARRLGISETLVEPMHSEEAGIKLYFKPRYGALGMKETTGALGIEPQTVAAVIDGIAEEAREKFMQ